MKRIRKYHRKIMEEENEVITVMNYKGGRRKTATAVNLAYNLSEKDINYADRLLIRREIASFFFWTI